jgi:pathogenesis-related protein 1
MRGSFVLLIFALCSLPAFSLRMGAKDASAPSASQVSKAEIAQILKAHNDARRAAAANMPPLQWSNEVAASAQKWANTLRSTCTIRHQSPNKYGENLFYTSGGKQPLPATAAIAAWLSEKAYYNYATNKCSSTNPGCGHYTQIVWRATTRVGCGKATCGKATIWVCHYDPMGNVNVKTTKPY